MSRHDYVVYVEKFDKDQTLIATFNIFIDIPPETEKAHCIRQI